MKDFVRDNLWFSLCGLNCGLCPMKLLRLHDEGKMDSSQVTDVFLIAENYVIEKTLGVTLIWNRGEDIKSSKIAYQLQGVSIENETDWLQMAKFHAEWSKKLYDVVVPYLDV
ncbi:MAG: DUF4268 domain-containing protein [Lachnospiraceae bacterium]|nr:DUF4268 domain-containing protein [Lachnospiraceae bacterium]